MRPGNTSGCQIKKNLVFARNICLVLVVDVKEVVISTIAYCRERVNKKILFTLKRYIRRKSNTFRVNLTLYKNAKNSLDSRMTKFSHRPHKRYNV